MTIKNMKEEKEDIETAEVVGKEETALPRQLEPDWFKRLKDRMVYIYGILVLDFFVVYSSYEVYNSQMFREQKGLQEMFIVSYRGTLLLGIWGTFSVIFDVGGDLKSVSFLFYAIGICWCIYIAVIPFIGYFFIFCYTAVVPWLNSGPLGGVLQVIWGLTMPLNTPSS